MRSANMGIPGLLALSVAATVSSAAIAADAPTCHTGTPARNRAVVMNFYRAYESGDAALLSRTLSTDFVSEPSAPGAKPGLEGALTVLARTHLTFSNIKTTQEEVIASGNKVVVRSTIRATHSGPLMGVPATNKPISFSAIDIQTVCNGKIVRSDHEESWLGLLAQIGALPPKK